MAATKDAIGSVWIRWSPRLASPRKLTLMTHMDQPLTLCAVVAVGEECDVAMLKVEVRGSGSLAAVQHLAGDFICTSMETACLCGPEWHPIRSNDSRELNPVNQL